MSSGDPIDQMKEYASRRGSAPPVMEHQEAEMDDEELRFQMEFQREMGMLSGEGAPTLRRSPSPPAHSAGDRSDESLADIVGDILDDKRPATRSSPSPAKGQSSPPSFATLNYVKLR